MQRVSNRLIYVALATLLVAGCSDTESRTDLNPEGPPMVRQVRMFEKYVDGTPPVERSRRIFAFGTHELAEDEEIASTRPAGMVTTAAALNGVAVNQLRVIMDELLVGNHLEEVACRGPVDADALSRVPLGATPEDIARCASPDDVLPRTCPASNSHSVCICNLDTGCLVGSKVIEKGKPVGVLDIDLDGAADETRMIEGAVNIRCGSGGNINVPLDLDLSYWNPSGDQNRPALGGFEALGPALVLAPASALPTNVECQLAFADGTAAFPDTQNPGQPLPAITDKQGEKVCTPPNGDVTQSCSSAGDLSQFKFKVEPLVIFPSTFSDMQMGLNRNIGTGGGGQPIDFLSNVPLAPASLTTAITFNPALPAGATVTLVGTGNNARTVRISGPMGTTLAANQLYTVTISTGLTDTYNQPLPTQVVVTFTTGA